MVRRSSVLFGIVALGLVAVWTSPARAGVPCPCSGDLTRRMPDASPAGAGGGGFTCIPPDGVIDFLDLQTMQECLFGFNPCMADCDINCDGDVNLLDLAMVEDCLGPAGQDCCLLSAPIGACCSHAGSKQMGQSCSPAPQATCVNIGGVYNGDGSVCLPSPCDCNNNGIPDGEDITGGTSQDCDGEGTPDECHGFACCLDNPPGACFNAPTEADCTNIGGTYSGPPLCARCPSESVFVVIEPGGEIFVHVIGPPVDCPSGATPAAAQGCPPNQYIDPWVSPEDGAMCHQFGVTGSPAIPMEFFGAGSDPFTGSVCFKGSPLGSTTFGTFGDADTLIRRTIDPFDRCSLPPLGPTTVPIEIVALNLVSVSPITVTYNGGMTPEAWDVAVNLSTVAAPMGSLTANKTHCNGGTFTSTLPVLPRFTFTRQVSPPPPLVLDTGVEGFDPINLDQPLPQPWVHDVGLPFAEDLDSCSDFHGGFMDSFAALHCDCNTNGVRDLCDIETAFSQDCNNNERPDSCDIGFGYSLDGNGDMIPDECAAAGIPTVSEWGLLILTMSLLSAGTIVFARRRATVRA